MLPRLQVARKKRLPKDAGGEREMPPRQQVARERGSPRLQAARERCCLRQ
jgi:hypothetical protein